MRSQVALAVILLDNVEAQVPYVELALGAAECANGTQIMSQALCQGAMSTLGLNWTTNSFTDETDAPRFCSHGDNFHTNMHWSNNTVGGRHPDLAPVCRETPIQYVKINTNLVENWAAWSEIEVWASDHDGESQNVALLGTATASSSCLEDYCFDGVVTTATQATDGDATTSWRSGAPLIDGYATTSWIEIDLGNAYYIDRVRAVFGPQPDCMDVTSWDSWDPNKCSVHSQNEDMRTAWCSNASLVEANFNGTRDCCACGGGDRARELFNGTVHMDILHTLHMAGPDHQHMEFEVWTANSEEVEYSTPLNGRPHGLFTCAPLENDIDYVGYEYRGRDDNHHHGGRMESAEACCALCQSEYSEGCRFWSWDGDDRCYLKSSNAGRTVSVGRVSGAVAQVASEAPHTQAQCEGEIQMNVDIEGFDIHGHVRAETADQCCALCSDDYANGCRYWTFHDDHCHLKSSNVTMRAREGRMSGSIGTVILEQAETMSCAVMETGIEYHGGDTDLGSEIRVASEEECCDQCQGAYGLGCRFWTYKINDGKCRLKTGQGERRDHSERISGSVGQVIQQETEATCGAMEEGAEYHGAGSEMSGGHVEATSAEHCCELCQESYDDGCRFWTFKTDNNHCHRRISAGDGTRQRENRISGSVIQVDSDTSDNLAGFTNAQIDSATGATISVLTFVSFLVM